MYIVDTNILIYFFKGMGNVPRKFLEVSPREVAIPTIVLHELEYGIVKSTSPEKRKAQLSELCSLVKILPFTLESAKASALIRANLEKRGTPIGAYDVLIAGITLSNQGVLVTNNEKEFSRIPDLKLTNWYV